MSDMVERVARAIYASLGHESDNPWDAALDRRRSLGMATMDAKQVACLDAARAAISAMREPSVEMSTAGKHAVKGCESTFERDIAETAYVVMIDAAIHATSSGATD